MWNFSPMYKSLIRPILFKFDPEEVHHFTFSVLKNFGFIAKLIFPKPIEDKRLEREVFGLKFPATARLYRVAFPFKTG